MVAFFGPFEQLRVLLVRPDIRAAVLATMQEFEDTTGHRTFVPVDGGYRTRDDQARIYADSLTEGFRAAPPGESLHEYGAAIDLQISGTEQNAAVDQASHLYAQLAAIGVKHGLRAGFNFNGEPDPYHFEADESMDVVRAKWDDLKKKILSLPSPSAP